MTLCLLSSGVHTLQEMYGWRSSEDARICACSLSSSFYLDEFPHGGTHSMRYFYTGVSGISDFPEFTAVALVDDEQFMYFDSNTKKAVPKTEWIRQNEGEDYWNGETKIFTGTYPAFKINIQNLKKLFNQSAGVHTWQQMCGCELDDDGTKRGYWQYGFDGEDFLSLDKSTLTWTAASPQAVLTKHKWEVNRAIIEQQKAYLENTCIDWLQKYVRYGKETLERKVQCGGPLSVRLSVNTRVRSTHGSSYFFIWMMFGLD
ncbi:patr class I histocompatibility antigen, B-1 alpha chain-like isoform X3 [Carassius gibelio]|uniref:patr class I histocompatibility antigen, B-1 alpha chain-like isoform X3 n=1 Tax=Carassius gibelio TaxID=101364 RepID=UPI0022793D27|nr:patr class I histocompatibility antigen, B-1 alpha chain-like isoform X3 [Carassius gibelio]